MPDYVKVDDLCERTTLSRSTLYNRIAAGDLRAVRYGHRLLVPVE